MSTEQKIRVRLVKSTNGRLQSHKACVRGLGLRRINDVAEVIDTPENRGMIEAVGYLLHVERFP
jgi:large subunit ribosomal protein L30